MDTDTIIRQLEYEADKHKNDCLFTGQTDITALCRDLIPKMKELKRYEDLEYDGRLLELPCKVGDTVYVINTLLSGKKLIGQLEADVFFIALCMMEKRFGKTVFLTQEAAEAALKEMEGRA